MDDARILAIVEERTRVLPDMDKRLRELSENQASMNTAIGHNRDDIKDLFGKHDKLDDKVEELKIADRIWNGINSLVVAVLIFWQTGKFP